MAFNFNWKPQDLSYQQYQFLSDPNEAFKNRANTKLAQEMLGFEGKDIDGIAGKATRNAYNNQMPYYKDLYGTVSKAGALDLNDPTAFYNDIHDAETYGFTPQEAENELNADILAEKQQQEAAAKEQKIASLESQIASLQKRIDNNTAKLKGFGTNADKIAAIEARKINSADPTSIWRWKVDRDEARRIANAQNGTDNTAKANAMIEIANDLDSIIVDDKMTSQDQKAYLSKLSNLKTLGEKTGVPKSVIDNIDAKIKEVKGETETSKTKGPEGTEYEGTSREQWDNEAEELLGKPNLTQGDIMKFKQKNPNISNEVRQKLEAKHSELIEADKKKTYEKKWNSYLADYEKEHGKVSDAFAKTLRRIYDKKNKKG